MADQPQVAVHDERQQQHDLPQSGGGENNATAPDDDTPNDAQNRSSTARTNQTISTQSTDPEAIEKQLLQMAFPAETDGAAGAAAPSKNIAGAGIIAAANDNSAQQVEQISIHGVSYRGESISALSTSNASRSSSIAKEKALHVLESKAATLDDKMDFDNGPPTSIIQQPDDDSSLPLINLDSMKDGSERVSEVSDFNMEDAGGGDATSGNQKTSWLNIDSSSGTSMGSQGSYADQVPALSGSTSGSNLVMQQTIPPTFEQQQQQQQQQQIQHRQPHEIDLSQSNIVHVKKEEVLMMMEEDSSNNCNSIDNHNALGFDYSSGANPTSPRLAESQNSDLDDILGPKGEPVRSDLDDILGPTSTVEGKPSDLDDTLGPYEGEMSRASGTVPTPSTTVPVGNFNQSHVNNYPAKIIGGYQEAKRPSHLQVLPAASGNEEGKFKSYLPSYYATSPASTPSRKEASTPTNRTHSISRRAIDHIGKALADRETDHSTLYSPTGAGASILPEASTSGDTTAYDTAYDFHPAKSTINSSLSAQRQMNYDPLKAESLDSVEPASTWASRGTSGSKTTTNTTVDQSSAFVTSISHGSTSQYEDETHTEHGDALSPDNQSSWASSRNDTLSPSTRSQRYALSPGASSSRGDYALSPSSRAGNSLSQATSSQDTTLASSRNDTFSPRSDYSRGDTFASPAASSRNDTLSPGEYSQQFSPTEHSRSQVYSSTEHSRTAEFSLTDTSTREGTFSPTEHSRASVAQFTFSSQDEIESPQKAAPKISNTTSGESATSENDETSRISRTATYASSAAGPSNDESENNAEVGGRMWRMAQIHAQNSRDIPPSPRTQKFAESIMARTRSRADPDALVDNASNIGGDAMEKPTRSMIKLSNQEESGIIENTALARKRVRVVQLLAVGLSAFLISFLGGFWVQSSCYYASAVVKVGENAETFRLRLGLWKYSPIDSVFQGYTYCSQYDEEFASGVPLFGRAASLIALIGGAFSLCVLWIYLVFGRCNGHIWNAATASAAISGALQLSTLSIFAGSICKEGGCRLGPAGFVSILASCFYMFLAYEMRYNTPIAAISDGLITSPSGEQNQNLVANLEMKDLKHGAKAYVRRLTFGDANGFPSLNQVQRDNPSPLGEQMLQRDLSNGSYQPPAVLV